MKRLLAALCLLLTGARSPAPRPAVPILIYHRIGVGTGTTEWVALRTFRRQMRYLAEHGYATISLSDLLAFVRGGRVPAKAVCITFDDGWRSQLLAVPILQRYRFNASFLVFPERGIEDPYGDYLRWSELETLARDPRFEIGAHSMTHPWDRKSNLVTWVDGAVAGRGLPDVRHEIADAKAVLEQKLARPVRFFAWPMGWYTDALIAMARDAGYDATLTVDAGANQRGDDPLRLKRLFVDGSCSLRQFAELLETHRYPLCASGEVLATRHTP